MNDELHAPLNTLRKIPGLEIKYTEAAAGWMWGDALIEIHSQVGSCRYVAEAKRGVTTTTLSAVLAQLERFRQHPKLPPLLLAPYLTPAVTERLLNERIEFADGAGNTFLDSPAAYVLVLGNKPERRPSTTGFTATDLELIYALLVAPNLRRASYRDINAATKVSLGKISSAVNQLEEAGHIYHTKSGALMLRDPAQLLKRWEFGYLEQLRPKLKPSTWRLGKNVTLEEIFLHVDNLRDVLIGGEYAASKITHYLKPVTLTLHVPRGKIKETAVKLRLPPSKDAADVTLLERFTPQEENFRDGHALDHFQGTNWNLVHPILVRAELLAQDDPRLRKTADRLLNDLILPELTDNASA